MIHLAMEVAAFLFLSAIAVGVIFVIFALIAATFGGIGRSVDIGRARRAFERQQATDSAARAERQRAVRAEIGRLARCSILPSILLPL